LEAICTAGIGGIERLDLGIGELLAWGATSTKEKNAKNGNQTT
jgi:hypothetical protein